MRPTYSEPDQNSSHENAYATRGRKINILRSGAGSVSYVDVLDELTFGDLHLARKALQMIKHVASLGGENIDERARELLAIATWSLCVQVILPVYQAGGDRELAAQRLLIMQQHLLSNIKGAESFQLIEQLIKVITKQFSAQLTEPNDDWVLEAEVDLESIRQDRVLDLLHDLKSDVYQHQRKTDPFCLDHRAKAPQVAFSIDGGRHAEAMKKALRDRAKSQNGRVLTPTKIRVAAGRDYAVTKTPRGRRFNASCSVSSQDNIRKQLDFETVFFVEAEADVCQIPPSEKALKLTPEKISAQVPVPPRDSRLEVTYPLTVESIARGHAGKRPSTESRMGGVPVAAYANELRQQGVLTQMAQRQHWGHVQAASHGGDHDLHQKGYVSLCAQSARSNYLRRIIEMTLTHLVVQAADRTSGADAGLQISSTTQFAPGTWVAEQEEITVEGAANRRCTVHCNMQLPGGPPPAAMRDVVSTCVHAALNPRTGAHLFRRRQASATQGSSPSTLSTLPVSLSP